VDQLEPVTQPYAWGSHTAIAELQGRPAPTAEPEAELWVGAHPSAPSGVERAGVRTTLDAVIAADPAGELGAECAAQFGGRLPFLLKVLGVAKGLSIQVHPSRKQAEAGYRAENERGLAPGDKSRNYVDDWPKPEILCALTRFEALAGMRTTADAAALLRALEVSELAPLAADLAGTADPAALTRALATILTWPAAGRGALVAAVVTACDRADGGRPPRRPRRSRVPVAQVRGPAARRGDLHARGRPARLPAGHRRGIARQLRQRGAGRAHV
jgi:mannose-6-phosphate isomerase